MTKKNKQRENELKSNKEGFRIYAGYKQVVSLGHFKLKSPTKGQTSKINFLNEKSNRRDIQKSDGSRPTIAYARLSTVAPDSLEKARSQRLDSYSKRVKFDLTIQQTIEGDFDEQG